MISLLLPILGGILCLSALIIKNKPNAKELIDKLTPYQGWIGFVLGVWGIWELIGCITGMSMLSTFPLRWVMWLICGIADFSMGMILGFGLISKYVFRGNATAIEKGEALRMKLVNYQIPIGFLGIASGVLYAVWLYIL